ncbi:oligosaccharide flippase family protein [Vibrio sp. 1CM24A]|uniref:lipopolysaccharide biosynthesis protein n=1 Tax=Vibrio sp. 1CM24A TaxID=2929165 RepID=UPI0020C176B3|nr:oligosaccharide flippase family protein [Vibrio sp. 1CM24A]MCK8083871.1 oligosaccharide flippase family protein [Vibrio sp. 1CM24A]
MILRKKNIYYVLGTGVSGLISVISIPLFTWYFSVVDIGVGALFIIAVNLLTVLSSMALEQYVLRNYYDLDDSGKSRMFTSFYFLSLLVLAIFSIIIIVFSSEMSNWIFSQDSTFGLLLLLLSVLATLSKKFTSITLRMESESLHFAIGQIIEKLIFLLMVVLFGSITQDKLSWHEFTISYMASVLLASVFQKYICYHYGYIRISVVNINFRLLKESLSYSIPLLFSILIIWAMGSLDKVFIKVFSGEYELGLYTNAFKFAGVALLVQGLVSTILLPNLLRLHKENADFKLYSDILTIVVYGCVLFYSVLILFLPFVKFFIDHEFYKSMELVPILMVYPLFYMIAEVSGIGIIFSNKTRYSFYSSMITVSVVLLCLYYLVPNYGAKGATISVAVAYFLMFASRSLFSAVCWKNSFTKAASFGVVIIIVSPFFLEYKEYYIALSIFSGAYMFKKIRELV